MSLLSDIKKRRKQLGLKQVDMEMRIGMNQKAYQRIEAKGNPRLNTLELVAEGLEAELMLVPKEKVHAILSLLNTANVDTTNDIPQNDGSENPWEGLLDGNDI